MATFFLFRLHKKIRPGGGRQSNALPDRAGHVRPAVAIWMDRALYFAAFTGLRGESVHLERQR